MIDLSEKRVGRRAEQKRAWDENNKVRCLDCGARVWRRSQRCLVCSSMQRKRDSNGRWK